MSKKRYTKNDGKFLKGMKYQASMKDVPANSITCPYCGGKMIVREAGYLSHVRTNKPMMVCENYPSCDCYNSIVIKGNNMIRQISTPADRNLRALRQEAHRYMEQLLDNGIYKDKNEIYQLMSNSGASVTTRGVHIGDMREYGCQNIIAKLLEVLYQNRGRLKHFRRWKGYADKQPQLLSMIIEIEETIREGR